MCRCHSEKLVVRKHNDPRRMYPDKVHIGRRNKRRLRLSGVEDVQELLAGGASRDRLLDGTLGLSLLSEQLLSSEGLGVRVESEEDGLVSQGVLLLSEGSWLK